MIQEDRLSKILELIEQKRSISVKELSALLYVSPATVRRDLTELNRRGLISRSFGGAVARSSSRPRNPSPSSAATTAYTAFGLAATDLVEDNSIIFLGGSPVISSMITPLSSKKSLTVVTDSAELAMELGDFAEHVICAGGRYLPGPNVFAGKQTAEQLEHIRYDAAFFSFEAMSPEGMFCEYNSDRLLTYLSVIKKARKNVVLFPREFAEHSAPYELFSAGAMNTIVTDAPELFQTIRTRTILEVRP